MGNRQDRARRPQTPEPPAPYAVAPDRGLSAAPGIRAGGVRESIGSPATLGIADVRDTASRDQAREPGPDWGHAFSTIAVYPPEPPPAPAGGVGAEVGGGTVVVHRQEALTLQPPSLLAPRDPAERYRLGRELRLDPALIVERQLEPATLLDAVRQVNLNVTALPTPAPGGSSAGGAPGTAAPPPSAPSGALSGPAIPAPTPLVPPGAGPETPRAATPGDLLKAVMAVPVLDDAVQRLSTDARDRVSRDWGRLGTGERAIFVSTAVLIGAGALAGVASDPESRRFALDQLNGRVLPVPGIDGFHVELNTAGGGVMVGLHLDVGRLLPPSLGFGPGSPEAIGGPPQPIERFAASDGDSAAEARTDGLVLSQPGDAAELEANRLADQVMRGSAAEATAQRQSSPSPRDEDAPPLAWRDVASDEPRVPDRDAAGQLRDVLASGGAPLAGEAREFFEPRFGHDFSRVRVFADDRAAASAQSVGALAYATGSNIVFGSGQYAPETEPGRRLLAHELAHVAQEGAAER